ncbi:josephin-like protein [Drosophila takahashii]|uniref:josephin-like protein n=1 Tax=Drosophila takahashii TaxID=29030 RepID=UPI001CF925A1|nr:josephin-like protein [Drosophila takahashii]
MENPSSGTLANKNPNNGNGNGNGTMMQQGNQESSIYHERQTRHLCGLHALNNLFQSPDMFSKSELDHYCTTLTPRNWLNPHRSWIGWGNYDVNVIMYALQQRNCEAVWFDRRRDPHCLNLKAIFGFILNVPAQMNLGYYIQLPFQMRHWLALRRIDGSYYNLDSKLREPRCLGDEESFLAFLSSHLQTDHELFLVLNEEEQMQQKQQQEKDSKQRWLLPQFRD